MVYTAQCNWFVLVQVGIGTRNLLELSGEEEEEGGCIAGAALLAGVVGGASGEGECSVLFFFWGDSGAGSLRRIVGGRFQL